MTEGALTSIGVKQTLCGFFHLDVLIHLYNCTAVCMHFLSLCSYVSTI